MKNASGVRERLKELFRIGGWTYSALADELGCSLATAHRKLNQGTRLTVDDANRIAALFGLELNLRRKR